MKRLLKTISVLLLFPNVLFSQDDLKEFEGVIKFKHKVIALDSTFDVNYDYSIIGKFSEFYYKNGDYKFANHDSYFKMDLFKSNEPSNYLVMDKSDTVLVLDSKVMDVEIIDYNIKESIDTIAGYPCSVLTLKLRPANSKEPISYRRYYFSKQLPINPFHFASCKRNAYEFIYGQAKALPLRIEFDWPNRIVVWEAYEVENQKLNDKIFEKESNWVFVNIK